MAVLIEGTTVVVLNTALDRRYPGGLAALRQRPPNGTFRTDGTVACVSFMTSVDARAYTGVLANFGLADPWHSPSAEMAVVDQSEGFLAPCDWLKLDLRTVEDDSRLVAVTVAWVGEGPGDAFTAPRGWQPGKLERVSQEELERDYEVAKISRDESATGEVVAYRHRTTGRALYIGRPIFADLPDVQGQCAAIQNELFDLESQPISKSREAQLQVVYQRAAELAESAKHVAWPLRLQGMAARLLGRWSIAEDVFRRATEMQPESLVGWLEWTWALGHLGRADDAEAAARRAVEVNQASPQAHGNLASALLQQGKLAESLASATRALELDPSNALNQRIMQNVRDAVAREQPEVKVNRPWYKRWFRD